MSPAIGIDGHDTNFIQSLRETTEREVIEGSCSCSLAVRTVEGATGRCENGERVPEIRMGVSDI